MPAPKTPEKIRLWKERMSQSLKGRPSPRKGCHFVMSEKHKRNIGRALKKYKRTKEHQANITKGITGIVKLKYRGENNAGWKGKNARYETIHNWVRRWFGTPKRCEHCGTTRAKRFDWANISKKYIRVRSDWKRLCRSCHNKYDGAAQKMWVTRKRNGKLRECNKNA